MRTRVGPSAAKLPSTLLFLAVVGAMAGCATHSAPRAEASATANEGALRRIGNAPVITAPVPSPPPPELLARVRTREAELLNAPLTQDGAVELAVIDSPLVTRLGGLLGLGDAERLRLLHVPDGRPIGGEESRIERATTANLASWLAARITPRGPVGNVAPDDAAIRWAAIEGIGALVFEVRRAWVSAVAASQAVHYHADVVAAAEVALDLAVRMRRVGHNTPLDLVREQRFHADAAERLARAELLAALERERLAGLMGLWGPDLERVRLPERLPDLPPAPVGPETLEGRAIAQRLDIAQAQRAAPQLVEERSVAARSELRRAWIAYRGAFDLAIHAREQVLPLARRASDEQLRRYNGMLASVFTLIGDAQRRVEASLAALDAERDFHLADVDLQQALAGMGGVPRLSVRPAAAAGTDAGEAHAH